MPGSPVSIACVSGKGGVGKTTTSVSLAGALAERGASVLAVDMDPQSNLTSSLGFNPYTLRHTVCELLVQPGRDTREAVLATRWPNLSLLPAMPDLAVVERDMASSGDGERRLRDILGGDIATGIDYIVIDTPPNFGFHTMSSLAAVEWALVPVQMSGYAVTGLKEVLRALHSARQLLNPRLRLLGLVPTFVDMRTRFSRDIVEGLREIPNLRVFDAMVGTTVKLQESSLAGIPITAYASDSAAAAAYRRLADEVVVAVDGPRGGGDGS